MKKALKIILNLFFLFLLIVPSYSEEKKEDINEHSLNFYTGMFDYSDNGQKHALFGIQHEISYENIAKLGYKHIEINKISPKIGITAWPKVSKNTNPGSSHGKPPNKKNLDSSSIIKQLARNKLLKMIFWFNCSNRIVAKGVTKTTDKSTPINIIIIKDTIMFVFP